jgi:hypothetical protein
LNCGEPGNDDFVQPDAFLTPRSELRYYVESVAMALGVEPAASLSEYGNPSNAYIALADTSPQDPDRLLMLLWNSDVGWCLALEPERDEAPCVIASWPEVARPDPVRLCGLVRDALAATSRGSFRSPCASATGEPVTPGVVSPPSAAITPPL